MQIAVNGSRLWFDVDGPGLVPDGRGMRPRPTVVLVHGGPGSWDHSYFKPYFGQLTDRAQVVYLDLRDHGRSVRRDPAQWSFDACADDVRAFCDALDIDRPIVLGHSLGGIVVMRYGSRHPGHAGALILQSTMARFDLNRLVEGFRAVAGDEVAELARRHYGGDPVSATQWPRVFAAFGNAVPTEDELARRMGNPELGPHGMELLRRLDIVDQLAHIQSPTLVCVGRLDPVTPVSAAEEIIDNLRPDLARLEVIDDAGHFPWLDCPDRYGPLLGSFLDSLTRTA